MTNPSDEEQAKARAAMEHAAQHDPRARFQWLAFGSVRAGATYDADGKFSGLEILPRIDTDTHETGGSVPPRRFR